GESRAVVVEFGVDFRAEIDRRLPMPILAKPREPDVVAADAAFAITVEIEFTPVGRGLGAEVVALAVDLIQRGGGGPPLVGAFGNEDEINSERSEEHTSELQ